MNINRNNYEEYFLLYADKELSIAEKNMVEVFVKQNPDLEEEFVMLQQSILKPDNNIQFEAKSSLFKAEDAFINPGNYEEKFLLFTDKELSLSEVEETEKFVLSHPELLTEFNLLQQVKYEPETAIVFPDKKLLYRKEEDIKVIPLRWKALAAAVLLGTGLWTGVNYLQKNTVEVPSVANPIAKQNKEITVVKPKEDEHFVSTEKSIVPQKAVQPNAQDIYEPKNIVQSMQGISVKNVQPVKKVFEINGKKVEPNELLATTTDENKNDNDQTVSSAIENITGPANKIVPNNPAALQSNYAQTASYTTEAEEKSENYFFYHITQEEFQKSKVGIFFKKVKRVIERKNPLREKSFKVSSIQETPIN